MLPSLVGLPCGPPQRHAAPCGVSMPPVQPLGVELKKQLRYPTMETQPPPPPPGLFDSFSDDIVEHIMSFGKGMDCKEIARQCSTSKAFNRMCQKDEFWEWQCQLHGFTHPYFLVPRGPPAQKKDDGPWWDKRVETWKAHYTFWCEYISLLAEGVAYNLHWAIERGRLDVVKAFLGAGADVNAGLMSKPLYTPLMRAVITRSYDVMDVLFAAGADVDAQNENGDTALHFAARPPGRYGHVSFTYDLVTVKRLLAAGANPTLKNNMGENPVMLAAKLPSSNIKEGLIAALLARK